MLTSSGLGAQVSERIVAEQNETRFERPIALQNIETDQQVHAPVPPHHSHRRRFAEFRQHVGVARQFQLMAPGREDVHQIHVLQHGML